MTSSPIDSPPSDLIGRQKNHSNRSTKRTITWAIILVLSTLFLASSIPKLGGFGFIDTRFERWGYPYWFEFVVGMAEATAAIFLIIPSTAIYATAVLAMIMIGAILTHLLIGQAALAIIPLIVLGLLLYIGWARRPSWVHRLIRRRDVGIEKTPQQ